MTPVPISSLSDEMQRRVRKASKATDPLKLRAAKRQLAQERTEAQRVAFKVLCRAAGLPLPATEYVFHDGRRWRFDYAWPEQRVAIEVDGGLFVGGAHVRGARVMKTHEKLNTAATAGCRILYCVPKHSLTDATIELCRAALSAPETPK